MWKYEVTVLCLHLYVRKCVQIWNHRTDCVQIWNHRTDCVQLWNHRTDCAQLHNFEKK
jgi:hypothetical protein